MQHKSNSLDKKYVKDIITKLVFAHTVDIYQRHLQDLEKALEYDKALLQYFYKNWHSCKIMWVHAYRANACSLGNNTNNRMESHNKKLKNYLTRDMHLVEAVKVLIRYVTHDALALSHMQHKEMRTCIDTSKTDKFCIEVSAKCAEFARKLVCKKYGLFMKYPGDCVVSDGKCTVFVGSKLYEVTNNMRTCICTFNAQYQLPRRHILAAR